MFCDVGMTRKAISDNLVSCWLFYKESHRIFRGKTDRTGYQRFSRRKADSTQEKGGNVNEAEDRKVKNASSVCKSAESRGEKSGHD